MRRFIFTALIAVAIVGITAPAAYCVEVSAKRALLQTLPEVRFDNISLSDAIDFLRDVSGANLHVNWRALEEAGIGKDTTVNVRLRSTSLQKILRLVLSEAGNGGAMLTYYVDENVIEVTTRQLADQQLFTKVYPVEDLIMEIPDFTNAPSFSLSSGSSGGRGGGGGGQSLFTGTSQNNQTTVTRAQRAQDLIDTIQSIIQPEIWNVNGGQSAIRFWNGSLIVTAPRSVHEALGG